jgi:molybdopterin-containing oxidoreductase family iron-sulfur binding subunit
VGASGAEAVQLAEAVTLLNAAAGSFGTLIDLSLPHALSGAATEGRVAEFLEGLTPEDVLIIHKTNPVFTRPGSEDLIKKAGLVIYLGTLQDETASLADWFLPVHDDLESWGEYEPWAGIRGLMQPAMRPLSGSIDAGDLFIRLAADRQLNLRTGPNGQPVGSTLEWLQQRWQPQGRTGWEESLRRGGSWDERPSTDGTGATVMQTQLQLRPSAGTEPKADEAALWLWPTIMLFDGRTANRGWIQEAPEPVSTLTWGSWVDIHPAMARLLKIRSGDLVEVRSPGKAGIQAPARVTDEIAEGAVAVPFGQGHTALGTTAAKVGSNAFLLLPVSGNGDGPFGRVVIGKTGRSEQMAFAMTSSDQHDRELLQWRGLDEAKTMKPGPLVLPLPEGYTREQDLYRAHRHKNHRWAMAIDLQRCIGCGACAVACYAENNIAVVGKRRVREGRHLPWLRIVPYRRDREGPPRIAWLPMLCQHCDSAPCEPVCPVFAAVNNEEGLNAQIYNRCIGTRYCSNNCPYKVRRFNWLNIAWKEPLTWQLNPEVTTRVRGVMEKCTFCIQRIRSGQHRAKLENRTLKDGEVQPACVQSCPAKVFTFGDLLDPRSQVTRITREDPRRYHVLEELNTKPAVTYLFRILQEEKT